MISQSFMLIPQAALPYHAQPERAPNHRSPEGQGNQPSASRALTHRAARSPQRPSTRRGAQPRRARDRRIRAGRAARAHGIADGVCMEWCPVDKRQLLEGGSPAAIGRRTTHGSTPGGVHGSLPELFDLRPECCRLSRTRADRHQKRLSARGNGRKTTERAASTMRNRSAAFSDSGRRRRTDTRRTAGRLLAAALRVKAMSLPNPKPPRVTRASGPWPTGARRSSGSRRTSRKRPAPIRSRPQSKQERRLCAVGRRRGRNLWDERLMFFEPESEHRRRRPRKGSTLGGGRGDQLHLRPGTGWPALNREGRRSSNEEEFMTKPLQTKIRRWIRARCGPSSRSIRQRMRATCSRTTASTN